jgi:hypothetical protein
MRLGWVVTLRGRRAFGQAVSQRIMLTPSQLQILQHSLGLDHYGQGRSSRNHFCASGDDVLDCRALVRLGYMQEHPTTAVFPDYNCSVTPAGHEAVLRESPPPPKLTRSQWRYRRFLEADSGLCFGEWLRWRSRPSAELSEWDSSEGV